MVRVYRVSQLLDGTGFGFAPVGVVTFDEDATDAGAADRTIVREKRREKRRTYFREYMRKYRARQKGA